MPTDNLPTIRTNPDMNARIVGILRLMPDEQSMASLYAAQLIEEQREEIERLTALLREAYPYLPYAVSLAEELAAMFPDIARKQDL